MSCASDLGAKSYFKVLACVARADGFIHPDEETLLRTILERMELLPEDHEQLASLLDATTSLDVRAALADAAASASPEHLTELLRDAYVIAGIDRDVAPAEVAIIEQLLESMRIPQARRPTIHEWARRAAEHHVDGLLLLTNVLARTEF